MSARQRLALAGILILGLCLRLYHLHNPILDHPAWRQGDEAAIARNFAQLRDNIFYPQTDYDGPPPNYVELELQIVPFAAALLYRAFGVHEIFLRLFVIAFSLATIPILYALGRELYGTRAGLYAALLFAVAPGTVYYGRAVIPESDMLFFSALALWLWCRHLQTARSAYALGATFAAALAALAKPPALLILAPMSAAAWSRGGWRCCTGWPLPTLVAGTLVPLVAYTSHLHAIAEWHWMTGITARHVLPALARAFSSPGSFAHTVQSTLALLRMLAGTVLGPVIFTLTLAAPILQRPSGNFPGRPALFAAWAAALAAYAFIVVTVERVDYYLLPVVLFATVYAGGALDRLTDLLGPAAAARRVRLAAAGALLCTVYLTMLIIHPYYSWNRNVYAAAREVGAVLAPGSLIVMGHEDPAVLYTIGHRGWEEDPLLWNVHDMTSAIHKGARYFVAVELARLKANPQLYRFLQRYRRLDVRSGWQVYDTRHFSPAWVRSHVARTARSIRSRASPGHFGGHLGP